MKIAKDMYRGCDPVYTKHMEAVADLFQTSRDLQRQREIYLQELAVMAQMFRDSQLENVCLMEKADDLIDRIFETKQHIEYLRKDILNTTKRH